MQLKHIGTIADWLLAEWEQTYSPLNVAGELLKMEQWLEANPRRRKKNYNRFVINWLNRVHASIVSAQVQVRLAARVGAYQERPAIDYSEECAEIAKRYPDLAKGA